MQEPQRHEMQLVKTHASDVEEWYCPTCGRRFVLQWPPEYKQIILEAGDEDALHVGGKGQPYLNLSIEANYTTTSAPMDHWNDWLKDVDLGDE